MAIKSSRLFKIIALALCFSLVFEQSLPAGRQAVFAQIAGELDLSSRFARLTSSFTQVNFRPLHLRYLSYDNQNNNFKLLLDKGNSGLSPKGTVPEENLKSETKTLLNYFFIGISLPNESFWVNLRPDAADNIIDSEVEKTDLGKTLLDADLQLKKDTANFTSPETLEGREYWNKLYKKAGELFGNENITIPTLTRPWIVPGEIIIRETPDNAYIYKATLKVMLEQDYLKGSAVYSFSDTRLKALNEYSSQLIRELIIPKLTKDVNTAKRYAPLRQVYYSLILAQWFKQKFYGKGGLYSHLINQKNLTGLTSQEPWSKTTYFQAYQKSFQEGEYNIKEQVYSLGNQTIRNYMSGGIAIGGNAIGDAIKASGGGIAGSPLRSIETLNLKDVISGEALGGTAQNPYDLGEVKIESKSVAQAELSQTQKPIVSSPVDQGRRNFLKAGLALAGAVAIGAEAISRETSAGAIFNTRKQDGQIKKLAVLISGADPLISMASTIGFPAYFTPYFKKKGYGEVKIIEQAKIDDLKKVLSDPTINGVVVVGHGSWTSWEATDGVVYESNISSWINDEQVKKKDLFVRYTCGNRELSFDKNKKEFAEEPHEGFKEIETSLNLVSDNEEVVAKVSKLLESSNVQINNIKRENKYQYRFFVKAYRDKSKLTKELFNELGALGVVDAGIWGEDLNGYLEGGREFGYHAVNDPSVQVRGFDEVTWAQNFLLAPGAFSVEELKHPSPLLYFLNLTNNPLTYVALIGLRWLSKQYVFSKVNKDILPEKAAGPNQERVLVFKKYLIDFASIAVTGGITLLTTFALWDFSKKTLWAWGIFPTMVVAGIFNVKSFKDFIKTALIIDLYLSLTTQANLVGAVALPTSITLIAWGANFLKTYLDNRLRKNVPAEQKKLEELIRGNLPVKTTLRNRELSDGKLFAGAVAFMPIVAFVPFLAIEYFSPGLVDNFMHSSSLAAVASITGMVLWTHLAVPIVSLLGILFTYERWQKFAVQETAPTGNGQIDSFSNSSAVSQEKSAASSPVSEGDIKNNNLLGKISKGIIVFTTSLLLLPIFADYSRAITMLTQEQIEIINSAGVSEEGIEEYSPNGVYLGGIKKIFSNYRMLEESNRKPPLDPLLGIFARQDLPNYIYYHAADLICGTLSKEDWNKKETKIRWAKFKGGFKQALQRIQGRDGWQSEVMNIVYRSVDLLGTEEVKKTNRDIERRFKRSPQRIIFYLCLPEVVDPLFQADKKIRAVNPNNKVDLSFLIGTAFAEGYLIYARNIIGNGFKIKFRTGTPMGLDRFAKEEVRLKKESKLPRQYQGFTLMPDKSKFYNEAGEAYPAGVFSDAENALVAFAAMLDEDISRFLNIVTGLGYDSSNLSPEAAKIGGYFVYCSRYSDITSTLKKAGPDITGKVESSVRRNGVSIANWTGATDQSLRSLYGNTLGPIKVGMSGSSPLNENIRRMDGQEFKDKEGKAYQVKVSPPSGEPGEFLIEAIPIGAVKIKSVPYMRLDVLTPDEDGRNIIFGEYINTQLAGLDNRGVAKELLNLIGKVVPVETILVYETGSFSVLQNLVNGAGFTERVPFEGLPQNNPLLTPSVFAFMKPKSAASSPVGQGTSVSMLSDVSKEKAEIIKNIRNKTLGATLISKDGEFMDVYAISEYPDLIFKIPKGNGIKFYPIEAILMQLITDFVKSKNQRAVQEKIVDGWRLIKLPGLAPVAYINGVIIQQRVDSAAQDYTVEKAVETIKNYSIGWDDQRKENAGLIGGEAVVIDNGDVRFVNYDDEEKTLVSRQEKSKDPKFTGANDIINIFAKEGIKLSESDIGGEHQIAAVYWGELSRGTANSEAFIKAIAAKKYFDLPAASSPVSDKGGIDLRSLPIATQQVPVISATNAISLTPIPVAQLNKEWKEIENMLSAGIVPSTDRIKIYLQSTCLSGSFNQETDKVLSCLAQILRMDEERVVLTDPALKAMLALLESDKPTDEARLSLAKIVVQEKEPKALKE